MGTDTIDRPAGVGRGAGEPGSRAARIDPRIRERRIRVQRDLGRRRLWKVGVLLGLVALVAAAVGALRSPLLDVDHIVVTGTKHTGVDDVVATSGVLHRVPLASVPLDTASRRIAALPWVYRATVRRVWPGTVRITVTERHPITQVQAATGGWLSVDGSGRVLERRRTPEAGLVTLEGTVAGGPGTWLEASWSDRLRVAATLPPDLRVSVSSVLRDRNGSALRLSTGATVVLGDRDQLGSKYEALRTLLAQPSPQCFATINVGVASAPALTRRPGCV